MSRSMFVTIQMGDVVVNTAVSHQAYSPDVADDLVRRTAWMFGEALNYMDSVDLIDNGRDLANDFEGDIGELPASVRFYDEREE
jgi:hypothetical protein